MAILSYIVFTTAQWIADSTIQAVAQTHPDQFPNAQRVLTAIYAAYYWIGMLYLAGLACVAVSMIKMRSTGKLRLTVVPVTLALFVIPLNALEAFQKAVPIDEHGRRGIQGSLQENLIILTSFMPNQVVEGRPRSEAKVLPSRRILHAVIFRQRFTSPLFILMR